MKARVFSSHCIEDLLDQLMIEIEKNFDPFQLKTILVSNSLMKQWLFLEIAKRKNIAMGLNIVEISRFKPFPLSKLELLYKIYFALLESEEEEVKAYLSKEKQKIFDLTQKLSHLFFRYFEEGAVFTQEPNWQIALFQSLFSFEGFLESQETRDSLFVFGIDSFSQFEIELFKKAKSLQLYLFSPCPLFWTDTLSDRERFRLQKSRDKISFNVQEEIDQYLDEAPKLLANWGKVGREMFRSLDSLGFDVETIDSDRKQDSLLKEIQTDLLTFEKRSYETFDNSIQVLLTGSSKMDEIKALRDEILKLNVPYSKIAVLAPNLEEYVPFIELIFNEKIPYRIAGVDVRRKSSLQNGFSTLFKLAKRGFQKEDVLSFFEIPSFFRKKGWSLEDLELFKEWTIRAKIEWGIDLQERKDRMQTLFKEGKDLNEKASWKEGIDSLLNDLIYLGSYQIEEALFEDWAFTLQSLFNLNLLEERPLKEWGDLLEKIKEEFFYSDPESEADQVFETHLQNKIGEMKMFSEENKVPLDLFESLLFSSSFSQIHSSFLHAVCFMPIEEGAFLPRDALFLIGMDETSFPKRSEFSSLDQMPLKKSSQADLDRYTLLKALFSTNKYLRISYNHLSFEDGKEIGAASPIEELISLTTDKVKQIYSKEEEICLKKPLIWPFRDLEKEKLTAQNIKKVSIADLKLLARHPWKFFLKKEKGIEVREEKKEGFAIEKGKEIFLRLEDTKEEKTSIFGPLKEQFLEEVFLEAAKRKEHLKNWGVEPFTLVLQESCSAPFLQDGCYVAPALSIPFLDQEIQITGSIPLCSNKGLLVNQDDTITGTLKIWPDALIAAIVLKAPQIAYLKKGKIKELQEPEKDLERFLSYYFAALISPSPLFPEWTDLFLRKEWKEAKKKLQKEDLFEKDEIAKWVFSRLQTFELEPIFENWETFLKEVFQNLIALYPTRKKKEDAAVSLS